MKNDGNCGCFNSSKLNRDGNERKKYAQDRKARKNFANIKKPN